MMGDGPGDWSPTPAHIVIAGLFEQNVRFLMLKASLNDK